MDEDSLSRDCEPFFESDGEEESTDGECMCVVILVNDDLMLLICASSLLQAR